MTEVAAERSRKPSVVDTLDHARRALSTHRQWLQRKVSSESFGVTFEAWTSAANERDGEWTVSDVEDEDCALQNEKNHSPTQPRSAPAPPTPTARKTLLKRRISRVSPAPPLQSFVEEAVTAAGPGDDGDTSTGGLASRSGDRTTQEDREGGVQEPPISKRPKLKWGSRTSVSPAPHNSFSDTPSTTPPPLQLFTSATLPPPSHPTSPPSHPTSPPYSGLAAWGSLSSLDNYMDSLETGATKTADTAPTSSPPETEPTLATLRVSSGGESKEGEKEGETEGKEGGEKGVTHISHDLEDTKHTQEEGVAVSGESVPQIHSAPDETEPQQLSREMAASIDITALQSSSTATVLPVGPAPRERQSSYEIHQYSKLELVGRGLKLIEVPSDRVSELESGGSQVRLSSGSRTSIVRNTTTPEPVIEDVLPYHREERVLGSSGVQSGDLGANYESLEPGTPSASTSVLPQIAEADEAVDNAAVRAQSETADIVSHTEGEEGGGEGEGEGEGEGDGEGGEEGEGGGGEEGEGEGEEGGGGGGGGGEVGVNMIVGRSSGQVQADGDISFYPQVTSTPSSAPEEELKPEKSSEERRRQILEELQLPPLRDRGEYIVSEDTLALSSVLSILS